MFFFLSLGVGMIIIYLVFMFKRENLFKSFLFIVLLGILIFFIVGVMIFIFVFEYYVDVF